MGVTFVAKTKEEIIEASKSKYCPVSINTALREIIESNKDMKFAVVGLPCHIQGIRKAELISKKLENKIVLHLGIFCNHTPNFWATKTFLQRHKIKEKDILKLNYRGEGWPGSMRVFQKNHIEHQIPSSNNWSFIGAYFFYPERCFKCVDGVCEFADISYGDAWLQELSGDKIGESIIISKNETGEKLINSMKAKNMVEVKTVTSKEVIRSQLRMLYLKKELNANNKLYKFFPTYNIEKNSIKYDYFDYLLNLFFHINSCISSRPILRNILCYVPTKVISTYFMPSNILISRNMEIFFKQIKR